MNPKREKKANTGIGSTNACNSKKPTPVAKDNRIDINNLSVFFKKTLLIIPRIMVIPKKIPFRIK
jgi:hypothetical protein